MCGIIGIFNESDASSKAAMAMKSINDRGIDGNGYTDGRQLVKRNVFDNIEKERSENILAHNLHSVVGNVIQPLEGELGYLAINCEIYNWQELNTRYRLNASNDADMILKLIENDDEQNMSDILEQLDGVYSFAYWDKKNHKVTLARDLLGVKPMWFTTENGLSFASERKALYSIGKRKIIELNPRKILTYDLKSKSMIRSERSFFSTHHLEDTKAEIYEKTKRLLYDSIKKRIPDKKVGVLFSGGIDSVFIAYLLKELGVDFTCYSAGLREEGMGESEDVRVSEEAASELGLKLKVKHIDLEETERYISRVAPLIEDNNVVKVGVGVTMFAACEKAKEDGVKVIFSGLGSEEIFAGYERHKDSIDINKECLSGLLKIYERDLYRDDVISMKNNIEIRLPFLDHSLVSYSLGIPEDMKISDSRNKILLRDIAKDIGIPLKFAERKKKAAQYGSKFDRAIQRLAKKHGYERKSEYLREFYTPPNVRLGVLWSGGKDSAFAAWIMMQQNYEIASLISIKSDNQDSFMFHTPNMDITRLHSEASGIPIIVQNSEGKKEVELDDLKSAISRAKEEHGVEGIVTGAIFSNYQRDRIDSICDELELKIFSPLWHMEQKSEMNRILKDGFEIMIVKIAAYGLDESWLGRLISDKEIRRLEELNTKYGLNIAGEGGEFESLVLDAPFFKRRLVITDSEKISDSDNSGYLKVKDAYLEDK